MKSIPIKREDYADAGLWLNGLDTVICDYWWNLFLKNDTKRKLMLECNDVMIAVALLMF